MGQDKAIDKMKLNKKLYLLPFVGFLFIFGLIIVYQHSKTDTGFISYDWVLDSAKKKLRGLHYYRSNDSLDNPDIKTNYTKPSEISYHRRNGDTGFISYDWVLDSAKKKLRGLHYYRSNDSLDNPDIKTNYTKPSEISYHRRNGGKNHKETIKGLTNKTIKTSPNTQHLLDMSIRTSKLLTCSEASLENSPYSEGFQTVQLPTATLYVYSAILDDNQVVLIALKTRRVSIEGLFCAYLYSTEEGVQQLRAEHVVEATVRDINEHHDKRYTAAFITCALKHRGAGTKDKRQSWIFEAGINTPTKVRLVDIRSGAGKPLAELPVESDRRCLSGDRSNVVSQTDERSGPEKDEVKVEFTVCSSTVHSNYSNVAQLVEMLEMSRLLGAGRVVLYNNSIAPNVDAVLRMYIHQHQLGRDSLEVKVHPWKLPTLMRDDNLHYFGQMAAINDCLYRYKHSSTYMVFTDVDEYIIPRQTANWTGLVTTARSRHPGSVGFLFRNTIFRLQWDSPAQGFQTAAEKYKSAILGHTLREDYIFPEEVRSKLIVDPQATAEMGIHYAWKISGKTYSVPPEEGLVQHYREALPRKDLTAEVFELCKKSVTDMHAVTAFGSRLAARLNTVWSKLALTGG
ncbi:UPF0392 protein F13G3.3 [Elysia marginata]|uniref:Glycosyltransferase family 92 protein n=1 Tax=Elysia marginata TaxID=1093978 RepID=A0AAV4J1A9_9GAST|nr:UPF0392 protein F13G3.3 [Elysia marginata]